MSTIREEHPVFRSCLYVPGYQPRLIERAYATEADAVIIDLEDAVPKTEKLRARQVAAQITAGSPPKPTFVRVNSVRSGMCEDDVRAVAGPGLIGVRLPKVGYQGDVKRVESLLDQAGSTATIHVLIESAYALEIAYELATASPAVGMLGLGESDLCADIRADPEGVTMDASRARLIMVSRAAGLPNPCQSVSPEIHNPDVLRRTSSHGKRLGFMGRMAIHPAQLPVINEVYTPNQQEILDAQEIFQAAELARQQNRTVVLTNEGRVIAPPVIANARNILRLANALNLVEAPA